MPRASQIIAKKGSNVFSIGPDTTVLDAIRMMNKHCIGAVMVLDGIRIAGIFTERDVLRRVIGEQRDPADIRVGDVMTRNVVCCGPDASFEEMCEIMRDRRIRHIPICDDGKLIGLISIGDINAAHSTEQLMQIQYLNDYIYGRV